MFLKDILVDFEPTSRSKGNYYNAILQNLFFATLNRPIHERTFTTKSTVGTSDGKEHYGIKTLFRDDNQQTWFKKSHEEIVNIFRQVPFLNGGLFECLDKEKADNPKIVYFDGFSRDERNKFGQLLRTFIPNCLFFDTEKGLLSILKKYNFTIEENTPNDIEVALDPELLGKVFENLLGAYNPETKETARNQSGSFYTPREIVNYMVDESLIAYLKQTVGEESEEEYRKLLTESSEIPVALKSQIYNALRNCKILDPACGSGAFPMGILNRIIDIFKKLDSNINLYKTKLDLIENCIYGVDIQTIAIQISKLRFFISLIVEQKPNKNPDVNYGILPLPNLESKFIAANTLIGLNEERKDLLDLHDVELISMKNKLWDIRCHLNIRASSWQEKVHLRNEDKYLCKQIENYLIENAAKPDVEKIKRNEILIAQYENEIENLPEIWVDDYQQQMSMFDDQPKTLFKKDINKEKRDRLIDRIKLSKVEIAKEERKGQLVGLEAEIKKMTSWDPYDQNTPSPFFDMEWMFGLKDGFDIVIGNPPYVQLQNNGGELAKLYEKCDFKTFARTGDIYCLFYERGYQLLKKQGRLCYITSNKWMRAGYGESTRKFFSENTNPELLIDLGAGVFESATVDTNILMFSKDKNRQETKSCIVKKDGIKDLSVFVRQNASVCKFGVDSWVVLSPIEQRIKAKIEAVGTPLKDWDINIYRGVLTGYNEAFIIDGKKKDELIAEDPKSAEIIRPILRGRDIKRYGYDFADLWLINTHNGIKEKGIKPININDYPAIKSHLDKYFPELEKRQDKGDTPYNLRNCAYIEDFCKQKIAWASVGETFYSLVPENTFLLDTNYFLTSNQHTKYLLAVLNSKLITYWINSEDTQIGSGGAYRHYKYNLEKLNIIKPIAKIEQKIEILLQCSDYCAIDLLVYELYGLDKDEIEFIKFL